MGRKTFYRGDNTFTELFTQKILDKEDLKQIVGRIHKIKVVF